MIAKVVGYQGFQSYGDLPYAALKPGRKTLDSNEVWEKTTRDVDKMSFYLNTNYFQTMRQNQLDQSVRPEHFRNVVTVQKGTNGAQTQSRTLMNTGNSALNTQQQRSQTIENSTRKDMLRTGVEHWQTNYQASLVEPYANGKAQRPEWTFHKPPYQVSSKMGPSEYKKTMGELGSNPRDAINQISDDKPRVFDELRLGTTQNSFHPPGYTGFIPQIITASKAIEHGQGSEPRKDYMKTNLKENFHTKIPGYAGHVPRSVINQREQPRATCFGNSIQD